MGSAFILYSVDQEAFMHLSAGSDWASSALHAEAKALLKPLFWLKDNLLSSVFIFTDCKVLADSINKKGLDISWTAENTIEEILSDLGKLPQAKLPKATPLQLKALENEDKARQELYKFYDLYRFHFEENNSQTREYYLQKFGKLMDRARQKYILILFIRGTTSIPPAVGEEEDDSLDELIPSFLFDEEGDDSNNELTSQIAEITKTRVQSISSAVDKETDYQSCRDDITRKNQIEFCELYASKSALSPTDWGHDFNWYVPGLLASYLASYSRAKVLLRMRADHLKTVESDFPIALLLVVLLKWKGATNGDAHLSGMLMCNYGHVETFDGTTTRSIFMEFVTSVFLLVITGVVRICIQVLEQLKGKLWFTVKYVSPGELLEARPKGNDEDRTLVDLREMSKQMSGPHVIYTAGAATWCCHVPVPWQLVVLTLLSLKMIQLTFILEDKDVFKRSGTSYCVLREPERLDSR
ncbi:hypothetical protein C5167_010309 [Papaver somniferum]|uniref:Uncharacterized protein n=1 Tax=Papaver somniferum TaxID=3469 RepID=A0A4Y7K3U1_PAPSO|nr:hypothetical protein C5167_010309 [Papaver somniferum]